MTLNIPRIPLRQRRRLIEYGLSRSARKCFQGNHIAMILCAIWPIASVKTSAQGFASLPEGLNCASAYAEYRLRYTDIPAGAVAPFVKKVLNLKIADAKKAAA
jgi:hypothetical protein